MTRAYITPAAKSDLDEIADYIAEDNPERARSFIREIVVHCHRIAERPGIGRKRPDLRPDMRSVPHGRYIIFYRNIADGAEIVRVLHGARDVGRLF